VETTPVHPDTSAGQSSSETGQRRLDWADVQPWLGTAARVIIAIVFIIAGGLKVGDLSESTRAVNAYEVMPIGLGRVIGSMLPLIEIAVGLLLLTGVATRVVAVVATGLFIVFITGIAQAWARGLTIDCGCFGGGGQVAANQTKYAWEIGRDLLLLALSVFVVVFPRTRYSLDARLAGPEENE
jgi:uncharacterized membrane protein YphA (DoxX/SURF4 family)